MTTDEKLEQIGSVLTKSGYKEYDKGASPSSGRFASTRVGADIAVSIVWIDAMPGQREVMLNGMLKVLQTAGFTVVSRNGVITVSV